MIKATALYHAMRLISQNRCWTGAEFLPWSIFNRQCTWHEHELIRDSTDILRWQDYRNRPYSMVVTAAYHASPQSQCWIGADNCWDWYQNQHYIWHWHWIIWLTLVLSWFLPSSPHIHNSEESSSWLSQQGHSARQGCTNKWPGLKTHLLDKNSVAWKPPFF